MKMLYDQKLQDLGVNIFAKICSQGQEQTVNWKKALILLPVFDLLVDSKCSNFFNECKDKTKKQKTKHLVCLILS